VTKRTEGFLTIIMLIFLLGMVFLGVYILNASWAESRESEDILEKWDREEKQRENLVAEHFGVSSKDFIIVDGEDTEYEVLLDGKYYALVFDWDYKKLEKVVYKGIDD
jgi:hypothetical protein